MFEDLEARQHFWKFSRTRVQHTICKAKLRLSHQLQGKSYISYSLHSNWTVVWKSSEQPFNPDLQYNTFNFKFDWKCPKMRTGTQVSCASWATSAPRSQSHRFAADDKMLQARDPNNTCVSAGSNTHRQLHKTNKLQQIRDDLTWDEKQVFVVPWKTIYSVCNIIVLSLLTLLIFGLRWLSSCLFFFFFSFFWVLANSKPINAGQQLHYLVRRDSIPIMVTLISGNLNIKYKLTATQDLSFCKEIKWQLSSPFKFSDFTTWSTAIFLS